MGLMCRTLGVTGGGVDGGTCDTYSEALHRACMQRGFVFVEKTYSLGFGFRSGSQRRKINAFHGSCYNCKKLYLLWGKNLKLIQENT